MNGKKTREKYILEFKKSVIKHAKRIGITPKSIHIQQMNKKWASCSTTGRLTFSADLLRENKEFRDYVIIHELLHLQVPNHGKLFKALMNAYAPGYYEIRKSKVVCAIRSQ